MPRGKWTNHKGRNRRFTNPEELEEERRREEEQKRDEERKQWRKGNASDSDSEGGAEGDKRRGSSSDESESDDDSETERKGKGVEKLIEISNPNRVQMKSKKLSSLNDTLASSSKPDLSRKEREELERQAAQARYQKLHAEGRTEEARADLARLAIIKAQREEAAKKRELEKLQKEAELKLKQEARNKALGKKK
ncbi:UNVERIFIED_CONTAM: hypothetical protein PYX00_001065 [Menopon gallinae]|uniref:Casein kinase substrate phosphoprotein PP28 domain-containing protein n=1 Tax=Menopon gallinae TaxID=328185 RepID=A0AAW2IBJ1_9NEOP